jgi:sugar lactone lactonase YvrE
MGVKKNLFLLLGLSVLSMIAACGISIISTHSISGTVTNNGSGISGVTVSLSGASSASTTTDVNGNYSFGSLAKGSYTITPSLTGYTFSPTSSAQTLNNADLGGVNFTESGSTIAVTTLAGAGTAGFNNGAGTSASFNTPNGIALSSDGTTLYVADTSNNAIREIVIATGQVTTLAGAGTAGFINGTGTSASFNSPNGIVTSFDGTTLYVADTNNNAIREIVISTGQVTTLAGAGAAGFTDGTGTSASFNSPNGIATDGTNLYVTDPGNNAIRKIVIATEIVTTLAGAGTSGFNNGTGTSASFKSPNGITISSDGTTLYVADTNNNAIREIVIATGQVTTLAGGGTSPTGTPSTVAPGTSVTIPANSSVLVPAGTTILSPNGSTVTVNGTSNTVYTQAGAIVSVPSSATGAADNLVTTAQPTAGFTNGTGTAASFNSPHGITTDGTNLYVADTGNNAVREIVIASEIVTTLVGSGTAGFTNGTGSSATFDAPFGIATNGTTLYVADTGNNAVREIQLQ